jgi:hypothetical protein
MAKRGKGRRNRRRREKKKPKAASVKGWRTSSATMLATTCVEVACDARRVYVRDSLDRGGPMLAFNVAEWRAFLSTL